MMAGRSAWLCHGTTPPGSTTSLRMRNLRSSMPCSCATSIMAITVSVTPTGFMSTGLGASVLVWSAGHSSAKEADVIAVAPSARPAIKATRPNRPFIFDFNISVQLLLARAPAERNGRGDRRRIVGRRPKRKCRLASNSIAERYLVHGMQPFDRDKVLADQGYPNLPSGHTRRTFKAIRLEHPTLKATMKEI